MITKMMMIKMMMVILVQDSFKGFFVKIRLSFDISFYIMLLQNSFD